MSYCRWSSDNFRCDLYVYESTEGFAIHVAANRIVGKVPTVDWSLLVGDKNGQNKDDVAKFVKQMAKHNKYQAKAEREPIGLPFDGETFTVPTAGECADKIEDLVAIGYLCPEYVIDTLRQEERDEE